MRKRADFLEGGSEREREKQKEKLWRVVSCSMTSGWRRARIVHDLSVPTSGLHAIHRTFVFASAACGDIRVATLAVSVSDLVAGSNLEMETEEV